MIEKLQSIVNQLLKIRNFSHFYHLNVKGINFLALHEKYKEIYEFGDDAADTVAELIKQNDLNVVATFSGETTETDLPCNQMNENLIYELDALVLLVNSFMQEYTTAYVDGNALLGIAEQARKQAWMLRAQNA